MGISDGFGFWGWVVLGLALIGLEVLAPGVFLLWFGIAALLTGVIAGGLGLSWQAAALVFVAASVACVLAGRALTRRPDEGRDPEPQLNRRGQALVGQVFALEGALANGEGRIRVGDSSWRVTGPDLPAGAAVRVLRVDGATLVVGAA